MFTLIIVESIGFNSYNSFNSIKQKSKIMKKETIKFIIQTLIAILTAIGTTLGVTSCMGAA